MNFELNLMENAYGYINETLSYYKNIGYDEDLKTKNNRVRTALTYLRKKQFIENTSSDTKSIWVSK